ncbi:fasciclin-like arabinogalactan protein 11 [Oryza brachyantha]|uniref:fasciclin-like arabinogalactan protein 11 n=1 Tax=Oryza brachyantha TaxID=4533 RepID=UPI001ADA349A|nr:fasciclin-like arabinogalactan protein 11 [Oryza brachyantha]
MAMAMATRFLVAAALCLALAVPAAMGQAAAPAPKAAAAGPPNVTAILEKGGSYTTFIRLMKSTQQDTQLNSQLNGTATGFTVFAPTDGAFSNLKAGTLNGLSAQDQVSLVQAHIVPKFYSMDAFDTASNPVRTQASGADGPYTLNITATSTNQVNVSTGVVDTTLGNALRADQPLAVYSVEKVLLPYALFGPKPPPSPPPAPSADKKPSKGDASASAAAPAGSGGNSTGAAPAGARAAGWGLAALVVSAASLL